MQSMTLRTYFRGAGAGSFFVGLILLASASAQTEVRLPDITLTPYGTIKLDGSFDDANVDVGNFARWVESSATDDDDQFNLTVRQTRLGLRLAGPRTEAIEAGGLVEVDFYEGGDENKNRLMLRHAYMTIAWPELGFSMLAGQSSDVIAPLNPATLNYSVAWWAGNIGYRRPQARLTQVCRVGEDTTLTLQGALSRTAAHDSTFYPDNTVEDDMFPSGQARAALSFPVNGRKSTVGVSYHRGEERIDLDEVADTDTFDTWSAALDVVLPLCDFAALSGELWTGENLDHYLGHIGQGVNRTIGAEKEVTGSGGWVALALGPWQQWRANVGAGLDDPDDGDLAEGSRSRNLAYWGNVIYKIMEPVEVGVEISRWETDYIALADGEANRLQVSFMYNF